LRTVCTNIKGQAKAIRAGEVHLMLSLIQLALNVDSLRAERALQCQPKRTVTDKTLAEQYAPGTAENTFRDWVSFGKKLLLLCGGGTLYLLPIIAALDLRTYITRQVSEADLLSLATALRRVKDGMWRPMVHRLMVPIFHMHSSTDGNIETLRLLWNVPRQVGVDRPLETIRFGFRDIEISDKVFDGIQTCFPTLFKRSTEWDSVHVSPWKQLSDPTKLGLPSVYTLKTPLKLKKTKTPVTNANRNQFTDTERDHAGAACIARDIEDLQAKVRQALHIVDNKGQLLSLLFKVPEEYRQLLNDAIMHIHTCMPGEFKDTNSREEFFRYLACHYSWYARYAEKVCLHTLLFYAVSLFLGDRCSCRAS
ncbi:hypothetical protein R3P38DRAFT_2587298, partial [Favolaschia claudopus]